MKNILILLTVLLLPLTADGQDKPSFSAREMADVRVATPGLFAKSNHIYLHLDSLKDHEAHFSKVAKTFLHYLQYKDMPEWENENIISKYYITTTAVEMAKLENN